jgi:hypothetical protein
MTVARQLVRYKLHLMGDQEVRRDKGGKGGGGAYWVLVEKPEGRRPFGRPRHRWDNNIKMDLQEVGWGTDWTDLAQDRDRS